MSQTTNDIYAQARAWIKEDMMKVNQKAEAQTLKIAQMNKSGDFRIFKDAAGCER